MCVYLNTMKKAIERNYIFAFLRKKLQLLEETQKSKPFVTTIPPFRDRLAEVIVNSYLLNEVSVCKEVDNHS